VDRMFWSEQGTFPAGHTPEDLIGGFVAHNEEVKRTVPAERLLVWSASDGWEPLCEFLEVPIPDQPFPHLNDTDTFIDRIVDGSLLTLQEWRKAQQESVPAAH